VSEALETAEPRVSARATPQNYCIRKQGVERSGDKTLEKEKVRLSLYPEFVDPPIS
jgi:hypothetical protein